VVPVKSGANITAGVEVEVGTSGQAITKASGIAVGIALNTVTSGADVPVALYN
jgi:transketolase N-terminal domain/subunit